VGKTKGPYEAEFPEGTYVHIADSAVLERFMKEWPYHNRLQREQLSFANRKARVKGVSFYHGGDELYVLDGIPGIWHEQCLRAATE
jgi:hypothetical protein